MEFDWKWVFQLAVWLLTFLTFFSIAGMVVITLLLLDRQMSALTVIGALAAISVVSGTIATYFAGQIS